MINRKVTRVKALVIFSAINLVLILAVIKFYKFSTYKPFNARLEFRRTLLDDKPGKPK